MSNDLPPAFSVRAVSKDDRARERMLRDVREGLSATPKRLPPYLLYDTQGSALYERITRLPEYYPFHAERSILESHAFEITLRALKDAREDPLVVELGAGSAEKTRLVLQAVLARARACTYLPIDVSTSALAQARERLHRDLPELHVVALVGSYHERLAELPDGARPRLALFLGSSIGNLEDAEARALLVALRRSLHSEGALVLGADLRKTPDVLVAAYDDASGVTAAFNKNVLARINRELGGCFDLARFRHVARWNAGASRIEMHLESEVEQRVRVESLGSSFSFRRGETIHTESSIKYDLPRVDALLTSSGFSREHTYFDVGGRFSLHLARVRPEPVQWAKASRP